jgi:hypothetical protein
MDLFEGKNFPGGQVSIECVERWMKDQMVNFKPLRCFVVDPYQAISTIQRFSGEVEIETFEARAGKSNYELATNLRGLLINKRLAWPAGLGSIIVNGVLQDFVDELSELVIRSMSYGWRLDHERNAHDDRAVSAGMLALHLVRVENQLTLSADSRFF